MEGILKLQREGIRATLEQLKIEMVEALKNDDWQKFDLAHKAYKQVKNNK